MIMDLNKIKYDNKEKIKSFSLLNIFEKTNLCIKITRYVSQFNLLTT